ncbi:recombinase family protein [Erythrobacteraceae bacterium WH01K]|nr:recombinase family protein [Erythrobacteraceae bacterium WH01K]
MSIPATIYCRISTREQTKGSGIPRQLELCRAMCARHGWEHSPDREIHDEGKSAYHGMNRAQGGMLWQFEQDAEAGLYDNGHVLVVEHLDRISRAGWDEVYDFLKTMTQQGVTVAVVDGERTFAAHKRVELSQVMEVVIKGDVAREESEKKSVRIAEAWRIKREKAQAGERKAMTSRVPAWIDVDPESKLMSLNPYRASVLEEMFQWSADGLGANATAKRLNERDEESWSSAGNGWQPSYIKRLLQNRAAIGEYQPKKRSREDRAGKPVGEAILDYYPQAISADLFNSVQNARSKRVNAGGRRGRTQANLFSGIAKCAHCGSTMSYIIKAKKGALKKTNTGSGKPMEYRLRQSESYLVCDNANRGRGCENNTKVRYEFLEPLVLDNFLHMATRGKLDDRQSALVKLRKETAEAQREFDDYDARLTNLVDSLSRTGSEAVEEAISSLEVKRNNCKQRLQELTERLALQSSEATPKEHAQAVAALRSSIDEFETRVKVNSIFRQTITSMACFVNRDTAILGFGALLTIQSDGSVGGEYFAELDGGENAKDWAAQTSIDT